jgi:hypothetical protein
MIKLVDSFGGNDCQANDRENNGDDCLADGPNPKDPVLHLAATFSGGIQGGIQWRVIFAKFEKTFEKWTIRAILAAFDTSLI